MPKLAKVEGLMIISDGHNGSFTEFYEEDFIMSDDVPSLGHARSLIRKSGMLHDRLKREVKNFKRVYEMQVISFEETKEKVEDEELQNLTAEAMKLGCAVEFVQQYGSEASKKRALKDMIEKQKERKTRKKKKADNVEDLGYID